jgi:hypothetical protein
MASKQSGHTAGQNVIMKSAKKLGSVVNDRTAGEAIHKGIVCLGEQARCPQISKVPRRSHTSVIYLHET